MKNLIEKLKQIQDKNRQTYDRLLKIKHSHEINDFDRNEENLNWICENH